MITGIKNIKHNMFQVFLGRDEDAFKRLTVQVPAEGSVLEVPFRYYKKSSEDYSESESETYPVISIQDFLPTPVDGYNNFTKKRFSNPRDTTGDGKIDTITEYPEGLYLNCRFEITVATKKEEEYNWINDWFFSTFEFREDSILIFNALEVPTYDDPIGDYVMYTIEPQDSPRTDGVFETVYIITLKLQADIKPTKDHSIAQQIRLEFNSSYKDFERLLSVPVTPDIDSNSIEGLGTYSVNN